MSKGLLERNAGNVVEEGEIFLPLPGRERSALVKVSKRLFVDSPGGAAFGESFIVDEARATNGASEQVFVFRSRVGAKVKASRHDANLADGYDSDRHHSLYARDDAGDGR